VGSLVSLDLVPVATVIVIVPILFAVMEKGASSSASVSEPETSEVVARIRDREITLVEMDRGILLKLYETRTEYRQEWLDKELLKTAAEKKGLEVREFVQTEVYRAIEISQEEIDQRYEEIKGRLPKNVSKEMVTKNIRGQLGNRKSQSALDAYVGQLKKEYGTTYVAPASERFAFDPNPRGGPEKGSPDARVTIVEFSDLQCGYCSRAHTYLNDLLERRGNDIRLIFKHLPLDMHDHATYAAAVAACAHRQGKFWPLADILFREQKHLEKDNIMSYAESAELDLDQLNMCLDTDEGAGEVTADIAEANDLGISSTPSFFINGHYIGSLPKGGLDHLIDRELAAYR